MGLPHAGIDLALCQLGIFPSLDKAFSKSGVSPLVCLVLRIHAIAGISNVLAIPQNRDNHSTRRRGIALLWRRAEKRDWLAIDAGELAQFDVIKSPLT